MLRPGLGTLWVSRRCRSETDRSRHYCLPSLVAGQSAPLLRRNVPPIRCSAALLGNFLSYRRLWRSDPARAKLSARSTLKPNQAQLSVVVAHTQVAGFACPLKTFFSQFPIVGGRRHGLRPSLAPPPSNKIRCSGRQLNQKPIWQCTIAASRRRGPSITRQVTAV